ncbi:hypothetical protein ACI01nite_07120 [Acetobacter cibinongensis]|uniref:Uncharacterized protein n=1 Tax=Acetobacter cibinongensis TaxID=146475 RepID=A0A0D6N4G8_9PROT|nr:hypothetical protein Abci_011_136 [Acetobacter cibinongensis]GBQ18632.1 hypothetical protein AA0482_2306 [Acetobacter cibinongensis NRIC 0482]GEL58110.1 hypothetical protein ACI01nite_07120 [Acetobacter cibinongensis]
MIGRFLPRAAQKGGGGGERKSYHFWLELASFSALHHLAKRLVQGRELFSSEEC